MRQEVYRVAYDEAKAELGEILGKFEQLRVRKDRIESVVEALKPLMGGEAQISAPAIASDRQAATGDRPVLVPEPVAAAPEAVPQAAPQASGESADPFQRRVENAIGLGSGTKDIREYSRLFNGGSSR